MRFRADIVGMNTETESPVGGENTAEAEALINADQANADQANADQAQQEREENTEIVAANLRALEPVYFAAMLEEAGVFQVVDRLVQMFSQGSLPVSPDRAGAVLYRLWKGHHPRFTAAQRRSVYARAFGLPCEDPGVMSNRKFNDLWLSFVSIVGMYSAELQVLAPEDRSVGPEEVLNSGRALAVNLSAHGHGFAWFAAKDFKPEIQLVIDLISEPEILVAFAAKDEWEVIQNVTSELGTKPNVPRGHTRAESGVIIIRWLANRRSRLLKPRGANILRHEDICEGRTAASLNKKPNVYPTDADLVTACEQWLGVTGTQEAELKEPAPNLQQEQAA